MRGESGYATGVRRTIGITRPDCSGYAAKCGFTATCPLRARSLRLVRCVSNDLTIERNVQRRRPEVRVAAYQTSPGRQSQLIGTVGSSGGDDGVRSVMM